MIKLYITNLGKYNEGELVGDWFDCSDGEDALYELLEDIGINKEYEEYFITDYETELNIAISEYDNISHLIYLVDYIEAKNVDIDILNAILEFESDLDNAVRVYINGDYSYIPYSPNSSLSYETQIGYYLLDEGFYGDIPDYLYNFIDAYKLGDESGYTFTDYGAIDIY